MRAPGFLAVAVEQRHLEIRSRQRQRNTRQTGTGPNVQHRRRPLNVRDDAQTVEQQPDNHLIRLAHRGEVVGRVPAMQQGQIIHEQPDRCIVEHDSHLLRVRTEPVREAAAPIRREGVTCAVLRGENHVSVR
jgi:hypothetical protein